MLDSLQRLGGGERLAIEGVVRLDADRFERTFCLTRWEDRFETEEPARAMLGRLRQSGVRVIGLRRRSPWALWAWVPLMRILWGERVEVLHAHLYGSNVWASVLGPIARVPAVIAHEHMWDYAAGGVRPFLDRELIARSTDAFIAVSREGRRRMIETERVPPDDIVYIPNGVPRLVPGDGTSVRDELGIPADSRLIASVGHLRPEKAYEVLIEALAQLCGRRDDVHAVIAGEGPERETLERLISELGLGGYVHLLGDRSDVADILAAADVAVCCSDFEGGPLSVMEYMDAGLPVVATRVGGLPELVREGETGLLVDPRDPGALAAAVGSLLDDRTRASSLGSAGRALRRGENDIALWITRLEELYGLILARKGVR